MWEVLQKQRFHRELILFDFGLHFGGHLEAKRAPNSQLYSLWGPAMPNGGPNGGLSFLWAQVWSPGATFAASVCLIEFVGGFWVPTRGPQKEGSADVDNLNGCVFLMFSCNNDDITLCFCYFLVLYISVSMRERITT